MDGHLDLLGLDAVRAGDAAPDQVAHAAACPQCRAAVDGLAGLAARLAPAAIEVPPALTRDILTLARPRRLWRPIAAAAAAALVLGASVWFATRPPRPIDIVDAYTVAVRLRSGQSVDARWDLNRDGRIDADDVNEIARRSVALR